MEFGIVADLIVERTVLGETSKRLVLAQNVGYKYTAKRELAIGNDWNVLKVGVRFAVDTATYPSASWFTNFGIGNSDVSHMLLVGNWGNSGTSTGYITSGFQIGKLEANSYTNITNSPTLQPWIARASTTLGAMIFEITRTSATAFSFTGWSSQGTTSTSPDYSTYNITPEKFSQAMFGTVPTGAGEFTQRLTGSTTSSEATYGDLDHVFFQVLNTTPVEISDITAVKVS